MTTICPSAAISARRHAHTICYADEARSRVRGAIKQIRKYTIIQLGDYRRRVLLPSPAPSDAELARSPAMAPAQAHSMLRSSPADWGNAMRCEGRRLEDRRLRS